MTLDTDEALFVAHFLSVYPEGDLTLFDVGAASGRFTEGFRAAAAPRHVVADLFEPRPDAAAALGGPYTFVAECALGSSCRAAAPFLTTRDGQLSHLTRPSGPALADYCAQHGIAVVPVDDVVSEGTVRVSTVDAYLGDSHLDFLKIDTEGFEVAVLQGARQALADGRIAGVQFEYGGTWIGMARLVDAIELLDGFIFYAYDGETMVRKTSFEDDYTWSGNFLAIREP